MKNIASIIATLLLTMVFSCSEKERQQELRLVKIVTTEAEDDHATIHTVTYNELGQMTQFRDFMHEYDSKNRLVKAKHFSTEFFTYDAAGRIANVYNTPPGGPASDPPTHTFVYEANGRLTRVDLPYTSILLTYDAAGNVTRESYHQRYASEAFGPAYMVLEANYDDKKNPMRGKGSPTRNAYAHPSFWFQFVLDSRTKGHLFDYDKNLLSYLSPNNPIELNFTDGNQKLRVPVSYKYNEEGFPIEVRFFGFFQQFEYNMI